MDWKPAASSLLAASLGLLLVVAGTPSARGSGPSASMRKPPARPWASLPLRFEPNVGQARTDAAYLARGRGYALALNGAGAALSLRRTPSHSGAAPRASQVVRLRFVGARVAASAQPESPLPGRSHYFRGRDPLRWKTGVPTFARVRFSEVYPGVDVVYYGNQQQLEYDLEVKPGGDPSRIRLDVSGTRAARLDASGNLILQTAQGQVVQHRPRVYQQFAGRRRPVTSGYRLARAAGHTQVSFRLGAYDRTHALVIDPLLVYSTFLGGSADDAVTGVAVDGSDSACVVGNTASVDFPVQNAVQPVAGGGDGDCFVTRLNPAGTAVLWSAYLGGNALDQSAAVALDSAGAVYLTGFTDSPDFPVTAGAYRTDTTGTRDAFITRLSADGSQLLYSTYLGGNGADAATALAVDGQGRAYVTGTTTSTDFPVLGGFQAANAGGTDAFLAKLNPGGSSLLYSTYFGGLNDDTAAGIGLSATTAVVVGTTHGGGFPVTSGAYQGISRGGADAFVTRITTTSAGAPSLSASTLLSGSIDDYATAVAVDASGYAYVAGHTVSADFPVTGGALQGASTGGFDAWVTKLNPFLNVALYSTYFGGAGDDYAAGIAVDSSGCAYFCGSTTSADLPATPNAEQGSLQGSSDAFAAKLNLAGSSLYYATYLGGFAADAAAAVAVDGTLHAVIGGSTLSGNFPVTGGVYQPQVAGGSEGFVARLAGATAPARPTNFRALAVSGPGVQLTWEDASNNETGFTVERQDTPGSAFRGLVRVAADQTTYTDFAVTAAGRYTYRLRAVNALGSSAYAEAGPVSIDIPTFQLQNATATPGQNVALNLRFTPNGARVVSGSFDLQFDSSVLTFVSVQPGSSLPVGAQVSGFALSAGRVRVTATNQAQGSPWVSGTAVTITLAAATGATGSTPVQVLLPNSSTPGVQVTDQLSGTSQAVGGGAVVTFGPPNPTLTLTSPGGGERWQVGSLRSILWSSSGVTGGVRLEYSVDGGATWALITASTSNDGLYTWEVPAPPSSHARVRIASVDQPAAQSVGADFTIQAQPPVPAVFRLGSLRGPAGTLVNLPVRFAAHGAQVTAAAFDLLFDPLKLTFVSAAKGNLPSGVEVQPNSIEAGRVRILLLGPLNHQPFADGTVATVTFRVAGGLPRGTNTQLLVVSPGTTVQGADVSDPAGEAGTASAVGATVTVGVLGDLDGDGRVTVVDLQLLINSVLGRRTFDPNECDINGDGFVTVADVQSEVNLILRISNGGKPAASVVAEARTFKLTLGFNPGGDSVSGLEFDLGAKVLSASLGVSDRPDLQIAFSPLGNGRSRVLIYSTDGTAIPRGTKLIVLKVSGPKKLKPLRPDTSAPGAAAARPDGTGLKVPYAPHGGSTLGIG